MSTLDAQPIHILIRYFKVDKVLDFTLLITQFLQDPFAVFYHHWPKIKLSTIIILANIRPTNNAIEYDKKTAQTMTLR